MFLYLYMIFNVLNKLQQLFLFWGFGVLGIYWQKSTFFGKNRHFLAKIDNF